MEKIYINGKYSGFVAQDGSPFKFVCRKEDKTTERDECNVQLISTGSGDHRCSCGFNNRVERKTT